MRPFEGAKGQGPPKAAGSSNGTSQRARSEDHVKMQRPRTRGATAAGETKRRAMQQSPRRQTAMMARHFTAGHCTDAPIPTLGLDASTPAAPLNVASSTPSALHSLPLVLLPPKSSSPSHGSLCFLRRHRIFELGGEAPRAPPGQQEQAGSPHPLGARSRRPPTHSGADTGRGEPRHPGTSMALTLRGPAPGCALNAPSPLVVAMLAPRFAGSIDRALQEAEAALGPLPPVADAPMP
jgi:hypothetical protein